LTAQPIRQEKRGEKRSSNGKRKPMRVNRRREDRPLSGKKERESTGVEGASCYFLTTRRGSSRLCQRKRCYDQERVDERGKSGKRRSHLNRRNLAKAKEDTLKRTVSRIKTVGVRRPHSLFFQLPEETFAIREKKRRNKLERK